MVKTQYGLGVRFKENTVCKAYQIYPKLPMK